MTLPGETQEAALSRKVRMHEFLMTGGVQLGYDDAGKMIYGPPISVADPVCPWHYENCDAWAEIVAGRGYWTRMEAELAEAEAALEAALEGTHADDFDLSILDLTIPVDNLREALEWRPRDALALRQRTPEQLAAERPEPKVYAKAGKKSPGNPWDRDASGSRLVVDEATGEVFDRGHKVSYFKPEDDSRDDAIAAFAGEAVPDVIEVDGDEGEEGEEG